MVKKIFLIFALLFLTAMTNAEAEENNLPFDVVATSYTEGSNEMLALVKMKSDGEMSFMVATKGVQAVGLVPYKREIYDFYLNKNENGNYSPLISVMVLPRQERGQADDDLGEWRDDIHILPFYAVFDVRDGQVICEKPFSSASGLNPSHYQAPIKNSYHEKLIEIFLTHMPRLHEDVAAKGVTLP